MLHADDERRRIYSRPATPDMVARAEFGRAAVLNNIVQYTHAVNDRISHGARDIFPQVVEGIPRSEHRFVEAAARRVIGNILVIDKGIDPSRDGYSASAFAANIALPGEASHVHILTAGHNVDTPEEIIDPFSNHRDKMSFAHIQPDFAIAHGHHPVTKPGLPIGQAYIGQPIFLMYPRYDSASGKFLYYTSIGQVSGSAGGFVQYRESTQGDRLQLGASGAPALQLRQQAGRLQLESVGLLYGRQGGMATLSSIPPKRDLQKVVKR